MSKNAKIEKKYQEKSKNICYIYNIWHTNETRKKTF